MKQTSLGKVNLTTIKLLLELSREQEDYVRTNQLLIQLKRAIKQEISQNNDIDNHLIAC